MECRSRKKSAAWAVLVVLMACGGGWLQKKRELD